MSNKSELNKEYKEAFLSIRKIVDKIDPINLFPGVPDDEYDPEVRDILSRIKNCKNEAELLQMVKGVFDKWFDEDIEESRLNNVGTELLKIKNRYKWLI
jgi:hypothetical protein